MTEAPDKFDIWYQHTGTVSFQLVHTGRTIDQVCNIVTIDPSELRWAMDDAGRCDVDGYIVVHSGDMTPEREIVARKRVDRLRTKIALMEVNIRALGSRPITDAEYDKVERFIKQCRSSKQSLDRWVKELQASGRKV